jgi:hypothetical protein
MFLDRANIAIIPIRIHGIAYRLLLAGRGVTNIAPIKELVPRIKETTPKVAFNNLNHNLWVAIISKSVLSLEVIYRE